jgi:peptide/nickel transport system ATP-binding protein
MMLDVKGLTVTLAGSGEVLRGVDLSVAAGECLAVVGESGAGKSVLARTLLGLTQDDSSARVEASEFELAGKDVRQLSRRGWRGLRGVDVSLVLQDALQSLDPLRTTEAEVGETLAIRGVRRPARRARVLASLTDAGLPDPSTHLRSLSESLSGGMRQRALIASALVGGARLIIADEPTTALDATVAARILALLARLRDEGRSLVLISHDLAAVAAIADRVAVLDHGRVVEVGPTEAVLAAPRHEVTRALVAAAPRGAKPAASRAPGAELVTAAGLVRHYRSAQGARVDAVRDVDLRVRAGETVGVVGESGSGKSTLARMIVGAEDPDAGTVTRKARCIRLIPQDPAASFDPRWTVTRILRAAIGVGDVSPAALLERIGLDPQLGGRRPASLSGGQRQRVAIARALAARPDLLVCDEPVSALDVTTQEGILNLLTDLQRKTGVGIVFISHDLAVVRKVSDRVMVMRAGRVIEEGPTEEVFAHPRDAFTRELVQAAQSF